MGKEYKVFRLKFWSLKIPNGITPVMEMIIEFHEKCLLILIFVIVLVFIILRYKCIKKNRGVLNLENTVFEIVWTLIPLMLILAMVVPSLSLLYYSELSGGLEFDKKVKVIGHQWYWSYEQLGFKKGLKGLRWDSYILKEESLQRGRFRNMEVDLPVVFNVKEKVRLLVTSQDVIHSWSLPEAGVKLDGLPGRLNQISLLIEGVGRYFGYCTELCGVNHSFMPVVVEVVC